MTEPSQEKDLHRRALRQGLVLHENPTNDETADDYGLWLVTYADHKGDPWPKTLPQRVLVGLTIDEIDEVLTKHRERNLRDEGSGEGEDP